MATKAGNTDALDRETLRRAALLARAREQQAADAFRGAALAVARRSGALDDHQLILASGLFDDAYYRAQADGLPADRQALVDHYLHRGAVLGLDPHPQFSTRRYVDRHPDIAASGHNALVHYLRHGAAENRVFQRREDDEAGTIGIIDDSGLFDRSFYSRRYGIPEQDAVAHYVQSGAAAGFDPAPGFSSAAYLEANPDVAGTGMNPLVHFILYGAEGRTPPPDTPAVPSSWPARLAMPLVRALFRALDLRIVRPGLPNRIGHLVKDFDGYLKERLLAGRTRKPLYIVETEPCNRVILDYWRRYLTVIEGPWARRLRWLLDDPSLVDDLEHDYAYTLEGASPCFAIESAWGDRPPLFSLRPDHAAAGEACLREMGIPEGAWFVCVHVREGGYSPADQGHHAYRDADIANYRDAIEEIVRRGGWCIRMGDDTMTPLSPMPGLVDYATSRFKSDLMDVFLCARCRFFLGTSSGLFLVSSAFGVPSALANMVPLGCTYAHYGRDLSIPKIYLSRDGRPIPFPLVADQPVADFRWTSLLEAAGLGFRENTADEIRDLVKEMLDRLDGTYRSTEERENRQRAFRALFSEVNYSWQSPARIGDAFLEKHQDLLSDDGDPAPRFRPLPWINGPVRNPAAGTRRRRYEDPATAGRLSNG